VAQQALEFYMEKNLTITTSIKCGEMIKDVSLRENYYAELPHKYNTECCWWIVLGTAVDYMNVGLKTFKTRRTWIVRIWNQTLIEIEGLKILVQQKKNLRNFILTLKAFILTIIDKLGIVVRTGHHCANRLWLFDIPGTIRAFSFTIPKKKSTLWLKRWKEQHLF
jgi:cysteine desulfurase/selenocysteine lyase